MELIGYPETSVINHKSRLHNIQEERRFLTDANRLDSEKPNWYFHFHTLLFLKYVLVEEDPLQDEVVNGL